MPLLRSTAIAVGLAVVAASSASGRSVPGPTLWELTNQTTSSTTSKAIRPLMAFDPRIYSFCGVDIVGGDIWSAQYKNPDACVDTCKAETGCDAATWTNFNGGTCWYKRLGASWASAVPAVGAVSFIRVDADPGRYMGPSFPANVDMPGNDIGNSPASKPTDCIKICSTNAFCFAYTWTNYNGGTCWLKNKAIPYVTSAGSTAEFTGRWTNPDTCLA